MLLMNFMYGDARVKENLTKEGLADVVHKLWAWIALDKTVSTSALKLLATFTTKCTLGKLDRSVGSPLRRARRDFPSRDLSQPNELLQSPPLSAAQSLTLTTILPGSGLRKTPNTLALIHVIVQVTCREIERAGQLFDNHKMHFAFHILRNAVHVHECRVCVSKVTVVR